MPTTMLTVLYLVAGVLFILSLGGLSSQESARKGNLYGVLGMTLAVLATAMDPRITLNPILLGAIGIGGAIGATLAARVVMTAMPQLVALLHSFVGLAAVLVGISTALDPAGGAGGSALVHGIEIWLDVAIGAITFTGSVVAWGKLDGRMSGAPLLLPGRHQLNLIAVSAIALLAVPFVATHGGPMGIVALLVMTVVAGWLGWHLVMAIGGADMPVVVSLLNSYSGWTAAAAGFMLSNDALIVTGALVGSSGFILSVIMCRAMNRSILSVVFGGFGTADTSAKPDGPVEDLSALVTTIDAEDLASELKDSSSVVIVPGYGMAVARAQHIVEELTRTLRDNGTKVHYAIHPVAGRLPGHMNVLLAEAGVPYDIVFEMEEINDDMPETDVVLVIGANDVVNPGAQTDTSSAIYGMPVIEAWKASKVIVFKRSLGTGYAGVQNPLFFHDNTDMYFGDARETVTGLVAALRQA
ncbi:MAG: NAD(P)(+) transhydrogenase (Re/Si-specific) subunit beta [Deltaproteobacteria bacterium]|nr:NAD(P)(+) transhydrogenase (Re/Si-specific) subunit beta [Deltaproteobacteria bacterium]